MLYYQLAPQGWLIGKQLSHSENASDSLLANYFAGLDLCSAIKRKVQL